MYTVQIISNEKKTVYVPHGTPLSSLLPTLEHPCGKKGICRKCVVLVNGKEELSCKYKVTADITVTLPKTHDIRSLSGAKESEHITDNMCFVFDIGTTTLVLALVSRDEKKIIKTLTSPNPQRSFGADVLSRIEYASENGTEALHNQIISALNNMISSILNTFSLDGKYDIYLSGNTTMLHLFFNKDCSSMGFYPYTPSFLSSRTERGDVLHLNNIENVFSLPCISSFVGADIVSGLNMTSFPNQGKYNVLIDLGTNAEVVLFSSSEILCTAASAGPAFEGVNISSGMSATDGAIYAYGEKGYSVIGDTRPVGICATGLIDIISHLLKSGVIDKTGYMECKSYKIADNVLITQEDIRHFQLAQSAVISALETLIRLKGLSYDDIDTLYVSGGFSSEMNVKSAVKAGLLPSELNDKFVPLNNSSLLGAVKYATQKNDLTKFTLNAEYVDLSANETFCELFISNMIFKN